MQFLVEKELKNVVWWNIFKWNFDSVLLGETSIQYY
jgi:hypothetical protein